MFFTFKRKYRLKVQDDIFEQTAQTIFSAALQCKRILFCNFLCLLCGLHGLWSKLPCGLMFNLLIEMASPFYMTESIYSSWFIIIHILISLKANHRIEENVQAVTCIS